MARTVSGAGASGNQTLKPVPPPEFWQRIRADLAALHVSPGRPANSFTIAELKENLQLTDNGARKHLQTLLKAGKAEKYGRIGCIVYFVYLNDGQPKPGLNPRK